VRALSCGVIRFWPTEQEKGNFLLSETQAYAPDREEISLDLVM